MSSTDLARRAAHAIDTSWRYSEGWERHHGALTSQGLRQALDDYEREIERTNQRLIALRALRRELAQALRGAS